MARGRRVRLQESVLLLIGLAKPKEILKNEFQEFKGIVGRFLEGIVDQQKLIKTPILVPFASGKVEKDIDAALSVSLKIRKKWAQMKQKGSLNLAIVLHKGSFPSDGPPTGYVVDCAQAIYRFTLNRALEENDSKIIISRDIYDIIQSQEKDKDYNFLNLSSQAVEDIPGLSLYELNKPNRAKDAKLIERKIRLPLETPPVLHTFIGRQEELKTLSQWLSLKGPILIEGEPGVGKSSLAAKLAVQVAEEYKIWWFTITEETTSDLILAHLNDLLIENKDFSFERYQIDAKMDLEKKLDYLVASLSKKPYLLFFDNRTYTFRDEKIKAILLRLSSKSSKLKKSKLVFITIRKPDFFDSPEPLAMVMELGELKKEESEELLKSLGLEQEAEGVLAEIQERLGNSPFSLKFLANLIRRHWYDPHELLEELPRFKEKANRVLMNRFFIEASQPEKDILVFMSALRKPVTSDFIARSSIYSPEEFATKFDLVVNFFSLIRDKNDRYSLHPLVRDFCYRLMPNPKFVHKKAAEIYHKILSDEEKETVEAVVEIHYHDFKAKNLEAGFFHLKSFWNKLIEMGLLELLTNELNRYNPDVIALEIWAWVCHTKGRIAQVKGEVGKAQEFYRQMLEASSRIMFDTGKAESLRALGALFQEQKENEKAIEYYEKCRDIAQRIDDKELLSKVEQAVKKLGVRG